MCDFSLVLSMKSGGNSSGAKTIGMIERKTTKQVRRELKSTGIDIWVIRPIPVVEK